MKLRAFTLVEMLVVIAIIALLLAIMLPCIRSTTLIDARLQCASRARNVAYAVALYAPGYDEKMPLPNGGTGAYANTFVKTSWQLSTMTAAGSQTWYGMGCLFKAGTIGDGRLFYCPSTAGWQDEYKSYSNPGPWGTKLDQQLPNKSPIASSTSMLCCTKGYSYWPLSRSSYTKAEYSSLKGNDTFDLRYAEGYPKSPVKFSDLAPNRSLAFDYAVHPLKGSGYGINVAYGDSRVTLVNVPQESEGQHRYRYPYQQDGMVPAEDRVGGVAGGQPDPARWVEDKMWLFTASLSSIN
jgi:prepilin-type N-terminal cleavage/methylation domain-containing protein